MQLKLLSSDNQTFEVGACVGAASRASFHFFRARILTLVSLLQVDEDVALESQVGFNRLAFSSHSLVQQGLHI